MPYDVKKQQMLKFAARTHGDNRMNTCLHPQGRFVSLHANIDFAPTQSSF
ncbi:MAG: hypothetical protein GXP18_03515 [Gammaproteobacteria bacterium]|nr:hypothetical protein [Gammaproteobacteria bacterium]